ncbi:MAG: DUF6470 family protein [Oscillospiraceae bacterium]|nr:DUF6470 family protein [Oscillospiraceae bacterium]
MLPRIEIHSQMGIIALKTRSARLEGTPSKLNFLSLDNNNGAKVHLKTTPPRVQIDQTRSWESAGLETPIRNVLRYEAESMQRGTNQIGRIAREGLEMMRIERGGSGEGAIQRIAARKGYQDVRVTIKNVAPPEITGILGTIDLQDASAEVRIEWSDLAQKTARYVPASVAVSWSVEPSFEIVVVPGTELEFPGTEGVGLRLDEAV